MKNIPITVSYKWTANELIRGHEYHAKNQCRPLFRYLQFMLFLFLTVGGVWVIYTQGFSLMNVLVCAIGVYFLFLRAFFVRWNIRRQFSRRPDSDIMLSWTITDEKLMTKSDMGESVFVWKAVKKVIVSPNGYLLYLNDQMFNWIPRSGFDSDEDYTQLLSYARLNITHTEYVA